jgi:adenosine/AMP kinase
LILSKKPRHSPHVISVPLDYGLMRDMDLHTIRLEIPADGNIIVGHSHFIKTVEDIYEAIVNSVPQMKFGIAFNEASGACLTRVDGNDDDLKTIATRNAGAIGAGHLFVVALRGGFPINIKNRILETPEVCTIFCATANPVEVIIAETEQGRGVLGVIDGSPPKGVETTPDVEWRQGFLRKIGYKR